MNRFFAMSLCGAALLLPAAADAQHYVVSSTTSPYQAFPLPNGGPVQDLMLTKPTTPAVYEPNDGTAVVPLPFDFTFYGNTFSSINVDTNGYATFGARAASAFTVRPIPTAGAPDNMIAPWWADFNCPAGSVQTQVVGQPGSRSFVIQWHCAVYGTQGGSAQMQLWLEEGSTTFRTKYGAAVAPTAPAIFDKASIGIEDSTGTFYAVARNSAEAVCNPTCTLRSDWIANRVVEWSILVQPDLVPEVAVGTIVGEAGLLTIPSIVTVRNQGATPVGAVGYDLFLSRDAILDAADEPFAQFNTPGIPGAGRVVLNETASGPTPLLGPGQYHLCVRVDPAGSIQEFSTANNTACTLTPFLVGADLTGSITVPGTGSAGGTITMNMTLTNLGTTAAYGFRYRVFLSDEDPPTASSTTELFTGSHSLGSSANFSEVRNVRLPKVIRGTQPSLWAFIEVDITNVIPEVNESNRWRSAGKMLLQRPDLRASEATHSAPTGCFFGEPFTFTYKLCNVGPAVSGFVEGIALSADQHYNEPVGNTGDPVIHAAPALCLGNDDASECSGPGGPGVCFKGICHNPCGSTNQCTDGLICEPDDELPGSPMTCQNKAGSGTAAAPSCKVITRTVTIDPINPLTRLPWPERDAGYFLIGISDVRGHAVETDENNNLSPTPTAIVCRQPAPDFVSSSLVAPDRIAAGETAAIFRSIDNIGVGPGTAEYRYVLSSDSTVSIYDIALPVQSSGSDTNVTVPAKGQNRATDLVRIPSHITPGDYYVGLLLDPGNSVRELNETNNTRITTGRIRVERAAMRILTASLPDATVNAHYSQQLVAVGGGAAYRWTADTLPPGLTLTPSGFLSGAPTTVGTWVFTASVVSGEMTFDQMLALRVSRPTGPLAITTTSIHPALVRESYNARIAVVGGEPPYVCTRSFGILPQPMSVNADCTITGTPTISTAGPVNFTVEARDARGTVASQDLQISVVEGDLIIRRQSLPGAIAGEFYSRCLSAQGSGDGTYDWSVDASTLPDGIAYRTEGSNICLEGTPSACGENFMIAVRVQNGLGQSDQLEFPLWVECQPARLRTRTLDDVKRGDEVSTQLEVGGMSNASFRLFAGRLPSGLTLDANGLISGTVAADAAYGSYNFIVEMDDGNGMSGRDSLAIRVIPVPKKLPEPKAPGGGCSAADGGTTGMLPIAMVLLSLFAIGSRRRVLAVVRIGAVGGLLFAAGGAQAQATYLVSGPFPFAYQELVNPTRANNDRDWAASSADMWQVPVPANFAFRYFGQTFTWLNIGGNGGIVPMNTQFPGTASTFYVGPTNYDLPSSSPPVGIIAPWWDDFARSATLSPHAGGLSWKVEGASPRRVLKVEWKNLTHYNCATGSTLHQHCNLARSYSFQTWIYEAAAGQDSTIVFSYGTPIGPDGTANGGFETPYTGSVSSNYPGGSVGLESGDAANPSGLKGLSCTPNCTFSANFPSQQAIAFSRKADLALTSVTGPSVGWAGVAVELGAVVKNVGALAASGFSVRFYGSTDAKLDGADIDLGRTSGSFSAVPGASVSVAHRAVLPASASGNYFILAYVEPAVLADEDITANNLLVHGPMIIGTPSADLAVLAVQAPASASIGSNFSLEWTARNNGNFSANRVPYAVVLSDNDVVTPSDMRIASGTFDIGALDDVLVQLPVTLPAGLMPGSYYLGVVVDPDDSVREIDEHNNVGVSGVSFSAIGGPLRVVTTTLPLAQVGESYCAALVAAGGDGAYTWSIAADSALPPGFAIQAASPRDSLLCGAAATVGSYSFAMQVASAGESTTGTLGLDVGHSTATLTVGTSDLPNARFNGMYEATLRAHGGRAPYGWSLRSGRFPAGLRLGGNGELKGTPREAGAFTVQVAVVDADGSAATDSITLLVAAPSRLSCTANAVARTLVDQPLEAQLAAAGGSAPYRWTSSQTVRLSTSDTPGATLGNEPPPGLRLGEDGTISGAPTAAGSYLWAVQVADSKSSREDCTVRLDVGYEQGLTVLTQAIGDAEPGVPYRAELSAAGGDGKFVWDLSMNSSLPRGLTLLSSGAIEGVLNDDLLEGQPSRTFSFAVDVRDGQNRRSTAPFSITLRNAVVAPPSENDGGDGGGCQTGGSASGLFGIALVAGLAVLRRRG